MTLNCVIAVILRFFSSIALLANYVTVVEDRRTMWAKYCLPVPAFHIKLFAKTNLPCSAVSLQQLGYLPNISSQYFDITYSLRSYTRCDIARSPSWHLYLTKTNTNKNWTSKNVLEYWCARWTCAASACVLNMHLRDSQCRPSVSQLAAAVCHSRRRSRLAGARVRARAARTQLQVATVRTLRHARSSPEVHQHGASGAVIRWRGNLEMSNDVAMTLRGVTMTPLRK